MQYTTRLQSEKIRGHIIWSTKLSLPKNRTHNSVFYFFSMQILFMQVCIFMHSMYTQFLITRYTSWIFLIIHYSLTRNSSCVFFSFLLGSRNQKLFVNVRIEPNKTFLNQYFLHHFFNFVQRKILSCQSIFRKKGSGERQANAHLKN